MTIAMDPVAPDTAAATSLRLTNIQGNILGGFNKDFQTFIFLHFSEPEGARAWLGQLIPEVATSAEVLAFNTLFSAVNRRRGKELGILKATWMNIAFTHSGLAALGIDAGELASFPQAYQDGMQQRAAHIGDVGENAPENWVSPLGSKDIHAVLIVAADDKTDLQSTVLRYIQDIYRTSAVDTLYIQQGAVRQDQPGHEHFGFKDGISQPGIRGLDTSDDPTQPDQGHPGQDLLWPGEFVLGYETQAGEAAIDAPDTLNTAPGAISTSGPEWTQDGSYLVFRRLRQNVPAFHAFVAEQAQNLGIDPEIMGAKLVGRYASGAPIEESKEAALNTPSSNLGDPSQAHPILLEHARENFFEYSNDPNGAFVPRAAHIRKAYPRDQAFPGENATQKRRLLRRGIPFGTSIGAHPANDDTDRGLLFLAYQADIEGQFEFVQNFWVNNVSFPQPNDGQDPIIAQSDSERTFTLPVQNGQAAHIALMQQFVTTTGGDYFFQPAICALAHLVDPASPPANLA